MEAFAAVGINELPAGLRCVQLNRRHDALPRSQPVSQRALDPLQRASGFLGPSATRWITGPKLHANGGAVNYLAGGGLPVCKPQATVTIPATLTLGEFVV